LQKNRDTDRGDQGCESGCVAEWPIGKSFSQQGSADRGNHTDNEHDGQLPNAQRLSWYQYPGGKCPEGADHEDLAVGKVDQLDDAVHHRVAQCDDGVDTTKHQSVDDLLDENIHLMLLGPCDWIRALHLPVGADE
jgi:hypothetical protein